MKQLVLVGGGHGHLEVLRDLASNTPEQTRITLINPQRQVAYSGMVPGVIAGHYQADEGRIDLLPLTQRTKGTLIEDAVVGVDLAASVLHTEKSGPVRFDYLSLDIGSTPAQPDGARDYAVPIKPMHSFVERWRLWESTLAGRTKPITVAVIGAGAGGVEIVTAIRYRLHSKFPGLPASCHLLTDTAEPVANLAPRAQALVRAMLHARGIAVHSNVLVQKITEGGIELTGQDPFPADFVVLTTSAQPAPWLAQTGLALDQRGFIAIDDNLRSASHPHVFAAGDCASRSADPHPKSGVYAVRQGPVLAANLRASLSGAPLRAFRPQRHSLVLISGGDRFVVAARGNLALAGGWLWDLKDWIDRRFVARYRFRS